MKIPPLPKEMFAELRELNLDDATPLWYYIPKESEMAPTNGESLGAVGARIVAEVFIGLLQGDKQSYLSQDPDWHPTLPTTDASRKGNGFTMVDLLTFADPTAADTASN